jgi:hypothetical protein
VVAAICPNLDQYSSAEAYRPDVPGCGCIKPKKLSGNGTKLSCRQGRNYCGHKLDDIDERPTHAVMVAGRAGQADSLEGSRSGRQGCSIKWLKMKAAPGIGGKGSSGPADNGAKWLKMKPNYGAGEGPPSDVLAWARRWARTSYG